MLARMQNSLRMMGKQIHDLRSPQVTGLYSGQRTELTWAKVIDSYENVPEIYKEFFKPYLASGQAFPYTILTPAYETFACRITGKLVCVLDRGIHILEGNGKDLLVQCYPLEGISHVEVSSMLLDFRIKIIGVTSEGIPTSSIFRCSSVTDYLFTPILGNIRLHAVPPKDAAQPPDLEMFDGWVDLNYKFMNLARHSLLGEEKVICAILQPEIRASRFRILGRTFYKTISPTHVCILTDRELIMIREELLQGRDDKYGGIWEYVPLQKVEALSVRVKNDDLLALSVQLVTNEQFERLFQASMKNEVAQLRVQFDELHRQVSSTYGRIIAKIS